MPIGTNAKGGLMKTELNFGSETYREDIARSNLNIKPIIKKAGWDLLGTGFDFEFTFYLFIELFGVRSFIWKTNE